MDTRTHQQTLFLESQDVKEIEELARSLNLTQFLDLLNLSTQLTEGVARKLNPLLVGIPHELFSESLLQLSDEQLKILCRIGEGEPLHYHLTLLTHELSNQAKACADDIESLVKAIDTYDINRIHQTDLESFRKRMQTAADFFRVALKKIDVILALAWNSNREELIERLTSLKENWLRYVTHELGTPAAPPRPATGVYERFDRHFGEVYGSNEPHPLHGLSDDDLALEALAALSIWYIEDYWEIGLLPGIEHAKHLQLDPKNYDEKARREHREQLILKARQNLESIGLKTVADLKQKRLYSKLMLMQYIEAHRNLIATAL